MNMDNSGRVRSLTFILVQKQKASVLSKSTGAHYVFSESLENDKNENEISRPSFLIYSHKSNSYPLLKDNLYSLM